MNNKIQMYKALRSVKEKMDKGTLVLMDKNGRPDIGETLFLINRVVNAVVIANQDPDLQDIKFNLDQSKGDIV